MPFRQASRKIFGFLSIVTCWVCKFTWITFREQKSVLWTKEETPYRPIPRPHRPSDVGQHVPSIELSRLEEVVSFSEFSRTYSLESNVSAQRPLIQAPEMARQASNRSDRSDGVSFAQSDVSPLASPPASGRVSPQTAMRYGSDSAAERSRVRAHSGAALEVPQFRTPFVRKTTDDGIERRPRRPSSGLFGPTESRPAETGSTAEEGRTQQEQELAGTGGGLMISYDPGSRSSGAEGGSQQTRPT